jgi:hypothetical protein
METRGLLFIFGMLGLLLVMFGVGMWFNHTPFGFAVEFVGGVGLLVWVLFIL